MIDYHRKINSWSLVVQALRLLSGCGVTLTAQCVKRYDHNLDFAWQPIWIHSSNFYLISDSCIFLVLYCQASTQSTPFCTYPWGRVKHTRRFLIPCDLYCSSASLPMNGLSVFSLHVKARSASKGLSLLRISAVHNLYPVIAADELLVTWSSSINEYLHRWHVEKNWHLPKCTWSLEI